MAKPLFGFSLAVALLLSSCGDVSVSIRFDSLTSGQLTLSFDILPEFSGVGGRSHPLGWPVGAAEWSAFVSLVQGVTLVSQSTTEENGVRRVTGVLRFANLLALEGISVRLGQNLTVIPNQNIYTMSFEYQIPDLDAYGQGPRQAAMVYLGASTLTWTVQTPRAIRELSRGTVATDTRSFTFTDSFASVLQGGIPMFRAQW